MPLVTASAPSPSSDLHAAYLDYLRRSGRGNTAYSWAARVFFRRWPDPRGWAAEPLETRLADSSTRPIITFLMPHRALRPGYDYLLERKLSSIWREIKDSPLDPDLDRFMTAAAELGFTERIEAPSLSSGSAFCTVNSNDDGDLVGQGCSRAAGLKAQPRNA